jgi:serine/threonine protein kinase
MPTGPVAPPFLAGAVIAGKYRLSRLLGEGAMGAVWRASNETTGGEVALKLIVRPGPELRVRLLREAQACCSIRHKNVVQVYDIGKTDRGDPFLVMELLSGETLADMLSRRRRLPQEDAAAIGRDIARALAAAHARGIVHRDLKPANVFLHEQPGEGSPVVKVLDFGVSKNLWSTDGLRTILGAPVGSPAYMSPEQARGAPVIDARSDLWSLGVVLYEMLTGLLPFEGDAVAVTEKVLRAEVPPIWHKRRGLDPALARLVMACLQRAPEARPGAAELVAGELERFTAGGRASPAPPSPEPTPRSPVSPSARPELTSQGTIRLLPGGFLPAVVGAADPSRPAGFGDGAPETAESVPVAAAPPTPAGAARRDISAWLLQRWTPTAAARAIVIAAGASVLLVMVAALVTRCAAREERSPSQTNARSGIAD